MTITRCSKSDYDQIVSELPDFWGHDRLRALHHPMFVNEFADCAHVIRMLNPLLQPLSVPMRESILGRALARVIAHEIYHIVADTTEHEEAGLAKAQLSARELAADRFDLSPASLQRIRAAYRVGPPAIPIVGLIPPAVQRR